MSIQAKPLWLRIEEGEPLTPWEHVRLAVGRFRYALRELRNTPELRERCIRHAIDGGAKDWNVQSEAERLARFIVHGK